MKARIKNLKFVSGSNELNKNGDQIATTEDLVSFLWGEIDDLRKQVEELQNTKPKRLWRFLNKPIHLRKRKDKQ